MTKIYTKSGDQGQTGLIGGTRVSKHHPRIEAYGTVDELNACLGVVVANGANQRVGELLSRIQPTLFTLGAELATPAPRGSVHSGSLDESWLEAQIDELESGLEPLKNFILPGGSVAAAMLHLARTICRRAERRAVQLSDLEPVDDRVIRYLNRLGDLLFVLARFQNASDRVSEVLWHGSE